MVYGKTLHRAKLALLPQLKSAKSIAILGGGTGKFTWAVARTFPKLKIEFIEPSEAMQAKAKRMLRNHPNVIYNATANFTLLNKQCDTIITPFFFDQFTEEQILSIVQQIEEDCNTSLKWLVTDFQLVANTRLFVWNRIRLWATIGFFRTITSYSLTKLPQVFSVFENAGYQSTTVFLSPNQLVRSSVFQRTK